MARQPTRDGRRVHMNVKFSEAEAAAIDEARGETERGTWLRETVLRAALVVAHDSPVKRARARAAATLAVGPPAEVSPPPPPPAGPRVSAGTATAVFQPAAAEPVVGAPVPAIRRASDITPPPRCQHKGTRINGGWCVPCQADVQPGGKLPANWVMPEGWSPS